MDINAWKMDINALHGYLLIYLNISLLNETIEDRRREMRRARRLIRDNDNENNLLRCKDVSLLIITEARKFYGNFKSVIIETKNI